jgi:two-component system, OmpR family, sensor histidine kinase KdpD
MLARKGFWQDAFTRQRTGLHQEDSDRGTRAAIADRLIQLSWAPTRGQSWRGYPATLALVGFITIVGLRIAPIVGGPNLIVLYMLAVVLSALFWGRWASAVGAVSSALLFEYFFVPPYRSFAVSDIWYSITLISLLAVGFVVSTLAVDAREKARTARKREAYTEAVYSLTGSLAAASQLEEILEAIGRHIRDTFQRPIVVLLPGDGGLACRFRSPDFLLDADESVAAAWVFEHEQPGGTGTGAFASARARYLPLKTWRGTVGVLGFQPAIPNEPLPEDQEQLLGTFVNQAALAITRAVLAEEAQRAELLQKTDELQKALLNSISHNLRTPIVSVTGALNSVLEDGHLLDVATQRELLETARDEAKRLDRLVQNLLDMTRLEGGAVHIKREPCDVQDVISAALLQLGERALKRQISVVIPSDLPLVPMDSVLIVQVIVNLLDNALKYSGPDSPVEVEARIAGEQLQVSVADCGNGIPEEDLERVFEKFYRVGSAGTASGVGLGLSICKGLVEAHAGRIWAERRQKGGTEVRFNLPFGDKT